MADRARTPRSATGDAVSSIFQKLNVKAQREIAVFNVPESFEAELAQLKGIKILRDARKPTAIQFALAFVMQQSELNRLSRILADGSEGDALLWFAYPKGTSTRYSCDFNRDTGWQVIRKAGFDSVRQVAIDEDWSALRFRRAEYVKTRS
jgi:hypothetical protein